jgi:hypothetical protein
VPRTVTEADWKLLRRIHPLALERYCERTLAEIERVTNNSAQSAHQRYLEIFKIIEQRDREIVSIFNNPKRWNALTMLARIRAAGMLTEDEFSRLSSETLSFRNGRTSAILYIHRLRLRRLSPLAGRARSLVL